MKLFDFIGATSFSNKIAEVLHGKLLFLDAATRDALTLANELEVYQTELQAQNHQLRESQLLLLEARDRYQNLYDFAPVGFATFDRLGNIVDLNLTLANYLGGSREKVKKIPFVAKLARGQSKLFLRHLNRVFLTREKQTVELELRESADHPKIVRLETIIILPTTGTPSLCKSCLIDVSYEKQMETALKRSHQGLESQVSARTKELERASCELQEEIKASQCNRHLAEESEEKYRQLFSSMSEALIIYDAKTQQIIDANHAAIALYGYSLSEFRARALSDLSRDQNCPAHRRLPTLDSNAHPIPNIIYHTTRHGVKVPVEISTGNFIWKNRDVVFAFIRNIQERLASESRLKLVAEVFESTNEAIMVTDTQYKIVMVNHAFCRITGYTSDEVMQWDARHLLVHFPELEALPNAHYLTHDRTQPHCEVRHRHKSGREYYAWENVSAVKAADGTIAYYISVFSDISQLKKAEARTTYLAHHDALTKLPNRLLFNARLEQSLQLATRHKTRVALLFLDLDRFKYINDTLGHASGDELLREIAERIKSCIREQDTVARLGGDEFTIILSEIHHEQEAANLATKIIEAVVKPVYLKGRDVVVSTSIGISLFPHDGITAIDLIKAADAAMYSAKDRGRQKFEFYSRELTTRSEERLQLEHNIRDNLATGNFFLCYQPQFDLASGKIIGVEALLRWRHADGSVSPPGKIIAVAEESSLIIELDAWVLRTACEQASFWYRAGIPIIKIAVNFSAMNLRRDDYTNKVKQALEEFSLPPEWIELEVTESVLQAGPTVIAELEMLKALGITLAIDDFGTGYSSLSSLKTLPIDRIKIDKSFITDVPLSQSDSGITEAIITMGHNLNLKVIAEGVENDSQWEFLQAVGCDQVQGFRFGKPVVAASIPSYLDKVFTFRGVENPKVLT